MFAESGTLQSSDMVWKQGMASWLPAQKIKGLVFSVADKSEEQFIDVEAIPVRSVRRSRLDDEPKQKNKMAYMIGLIAGVGIFVLLGAVILAVVLFSSVSTPSVPTQDMALKVLEEWWQERKLQEHKVREQARIIDVRKTDGQRQEIFGVIQYGMECEVRVEVLRDFEGLNLMPGGLNRPLRGRKGEILAGTVRFEFQKSEMGWRGRVVN